MKRTHVSGPLWMIVAVLLACPSCFGLHSLGHGEIDHLAAQSLSDDPAIRLKAVQALGLTGAAQAEEPLVSTLQHDSSSEVTWAAAKSLALVGAASIEPLSAMLRDTLQSYDTVQVGPSAMRRKQDTSGPWRRWCAAWALAHVTGDNATESLFAALNSNEWAVRTEAGLALAKRASAVGPLLLHKFDSLPPMAQARAVWLLGEMRYEKAIPLLLRVYGKEGTPDSLRGWQRMMDSYVLEALGKTGLSGCRTTVNLLERSGSVDVFRAIPFLQSFGKAALPALISALESRNPDVQWATAVVLERLGQFRGHTIKNY